MSIKATLGLGISLGRNVVGACTLLGRKYVSNLPTIVLNCTDECRGDILLFHRQPSRFEVAWQRPITNKERRLREAPHPWEAPIPRSELLASELRELQIKGYVPLPNERE